MYGAETKRSGARTNQIAAPPPSASTPSGGKAADKSAFNWFPVYLVIAVALYFVWAILEQHQKIKTALEPKAIGINLRNLAVIMTTVVLGLNLFKIGAVKFSVWLAQLTGGRFRARWLVYLAGGA